MTNNFIPLNENFYALKALGISCIINNRPDNEEFDQPKSDEIETAVHAAGMSYASIPVVGSGITGDHLDEFMKALETCDGIALGFCKSGTRSVILRAFALARAGHSIDLLIREAEAAGYQITGHRNAMKMLAAQHS